MIKSETESKKIKNPRIWFPITKLLIFFVIIVMSINIMLSSISLEHQESYNKSTNTKKVREKTNFLNKFIKKLRLLYDL